MQINSIDVFYKLESTFSIFFHISSLIFLFYIEHTNTQTTTLILIKQSKRKQTLELERKKIVKLALNKKEI